MELFVEQILSKCARSVLGLLILRKRVFTTPENSFFQMWSYARAYVRITYEKNKGKFP